MVLIHTNNHGNSETYLATALYLSLNMTSVYIQEPLHYGQNIKSNTVCMDLRIARDRSCMGPMISTPATIHHHLWSSVQHYLGHAGDHRIIHYWQNNLLAYCVLLQSVHIMTGLEFDHELIRVSTEGRRDWYVCESSTQYVYLIAGVIPCMV